MRLTQTDVAQTLQVNRTAVTLWERGINIPDSKRLPVLANLFECNISDFFNFTTRKEAEGPFELFTNKLNPRALTLYRKKKSLTQIQLAFALNVDRTTISAWENGKFIPSSKKLPEIAQILECSVDDLYRNLETEEGSI